MFVGEPTFPGCRIRVRPVGLFRMTDEKGEDEKILCVPLRDPSWSHVQDLDGLPQPLLNEIEHFFQVYKDLEGHKVVTDGYEDRASAARTIADAFERAKAHARPLVTATSRRTAPRVHPSASGARDRDAFLTAVRASPGAAPPVGPAARRRRLLRRVAGERPGPRDGAPPGRLRDDGGLAAYFGISQIFYGPLRSAYLGYFAFEPHAGKGYMREGLDLVAAPRLRPARAAPARGQHPARQRRVDRARARGRLPARRGSRPGI